MELQTDQINVCLIAGFHRQLNLLVNFIQSLFLRYFLFYKHNWTSKKYRLGKTEYLTDNWKIMPVPKQIKKYNTKSFGFVLLNYNLILKVGKCFVIFLFSSYNKAEHSLEI